MSVWEVLFLLYVMILTSPVVAYFVMRFGTTGYLMAMSRYRKLQEKD